MRMEEVGRVVTLRHVRCIWVKIEDKSDKRIMMYTHTHIHSSIQRYVFYRRISWTKSTGGDLFAFDDDTVMMSGVS